MYPRPRQQSSREENWTVRYAASSASAPKTPPEPAKAQSSSRNETTEAEHRASQERIDAEAIANWKMQERRGRIQRDVITLIVAAVATCQILGTANKISWTPGLLLHGGVERLIDYAIQHGFGFATWIKLGMDGIICGYWVVLCLASSRLCQDNSPASNPATEVHKIMIQRRIAYLWPLILLILSHIIGAAIAARGWWLLAIPFEMGGHLGMAFLLYVFLVQEARSSLVIVLDVSAGGKCFGNRLHITSGTCGRRWSAIRHDHFREAAMRSPLWARLLGVADLEILYLDAWNERQVVLIRAIGSSKEVAIIVARLNGPFRDGRALVFTLPPSFANTPQPQDPPRQ